MIHESECEKRSKFVQELLLRIRISNEEFLFGSVLFSHYENDYYDFYRAQFRRIVIHNQDLPRWRMDPSEYQILNDTIQATVFKNDKKIKFSPKGHIIISSKHRGLGIGTYLFSKVIDWCKIKYSDYDVRCGSLSAVDATTENKQRRNSFYKNRGFKLTFHDQQEERGHFSIDKVHRLNSNWNREKIQEISIHAFIEQVGFNAATEIRELKLKLKSYRGREECFKIIIKNQRIKIKILMLILFTLFFLFKFIL